MPKFIPSREFRVLEYRKLYICLKTLNLGSSPEADTCWYCLLLCSVKKRTQFSPFPLMQWFLGIKKNQSWNYFITTNLKSQQSNAHPKKDHNQNGHIIWKEEREMLTRSLKMTYATTKKKTKRISNSANRTKSNTESTARVKIDRDGTSSLLPPLANLFAIVSANTLNNYKCWIWKRDSHHLWISTTITRAPNFRF